MQGLSFPSTFEEDTNLLCGRSWPSKGINDSLTPDVDDDPRVW
jgi:hypothetical protein